ncbi:hypothetical protein FIBSPDRAFT_851234 [Athelia psychrophila]|uniref:Uncharacterized protein n=1 Tax=Athelia psychrophila TaxID=1759441 RepID=A0A166SN47_9AGAM|nr:hypothetical protein FIBSPDRAFT_851234 [Fibularhizoctonia sp. CBS 109695]
MHKQRFASTGHHVPYTRVASLRRAPTSSSASTFRRHASLNTEGSAPQAHPIPQLPRTQRI